MNSLMNMGGDQVQAPMTTASTSRACRTRTAASISRRLRSPYHLLSGPRSCSRASTTSTPPSLSTRPSSACFSRRNRSTASEEMPSSRASVQCTIAAFINALVAARSGPFG